MGFFKSRGLQIPSANMFALTRGAQISSILPRLGPRALDLRTYSTTTTPSDRTSDRVPTNDPSPPKPVQNVSDSNAVPIFPQGLRDSDRPLQEMPEDSERQRVMQAPNKGGVWSRSQQPRERAMSGPRFEQTIMKYQVHSISLGDPLPEGGAKELTDSDGNCVAPTRSRHQSHSQAARKMDKDKDYILRRRWRTTGTSKDFHQCGQAPDLLVYLLRPTLCKSTSGTSCYKSP